MLGLWIWICIWCKSIASIWAIMQWLARYPSCPGYCMMRWQYLAKQSCSRCWLLTWTTEAVYYVWDGFYWWLCRSMNLQVQVCEWHYHASQVEWALRICACEHMRSDDDEPTRPCLQGRWMVKVVAWRRGLWRSRPNLFLLVSLDDELCFFYFSRIGFYYDDWLCYGLLMSLLG